MPSPFAITAATNSVRLDAARRGEAAFTVFNSSGRPIRARARLVPEDPATAAWLTLEGNAERDFAIAGTEQYTVQIAVPPDAPAGSYPFRLDMVGVENPDEDYTAGPTVTFVVPEPEPQKRPFPWWILLVVAGLLAVCGLVVCCLVAFAIWPRAGVEEQVLRPHEALSVHYWRSRGGGSGFSQKDTYNYRAGASHREDLPPAGESITLLSFDIESLRGVEIQDARLDLGQPDTVGDPFAVYGNLLVEEVSYADFLSAPYDYTRPPLNILFNLSRAPTELDVKQALVGAIRRGSTRFQLRLRFRDVRIGDELTEPDNYLEWDASAIALTVSFSR